MVFYLDIIKKVYTYPKDNSEDEEQQHQDLVESLIQRTDRKINYIIIGILNNKFSILHKG
jgi:hypothetical protein